ncbi:hypothetical protein [Bacillus sp. AK128]
MSQRNNDQYKVVKGPKAKESKVEASYEYLTGNETSSPKDKGKK